MATVFSREQWEFIVRLAARLTAPEVIVLKFGNRWKDTRCTLDDLEQFGRDKLPLDWRAFYDAEYERFRQSPLADKMTRIGVWTDLYFDAVARGAKAEAARYLEMIAKEASDGFAPRGPGGKVADPAADKEPIARIERVIIDPKESEASEPCES